MLRHVIAHVYEAASNLNIERHVWVFFPRIPIPVAALHQPMAPRHGYLQYPLGNPSSDEG